MDQNLQKLNDLSRCAEVGLTAAAHLFGLPPDATPEAFFAQVQETAKAVLTQSSKPDAAGNSPHPQPHTPHSPLPTPKVTYRQQQAVLEILRDHKRPDGLDRLIEDGTALSPALLTPWLDALANQTLAEYAIRALCRMGPGILPAVRARYSQRTDNNEQITTETTGRTTAGRGLLRVLLTLSDDTALPALMPALEETLARQDFAALSEILPAIAGSPKPIFYHFLTKLLPVLITHPGCHVFLVGACLDAVAAYETPESTAFLEEMLALCEHHVRALA